MNDILFQFVLASLIRSIKNPEKKAKLKPIMRDAVKSILLAYQDDPNFLDEEDQH